MKWMSGSGKIKDTKWTGDGWNVLTLDNLLPTSYHNTVAAKKKSLLKSSKNLEFEECKSQKFSATGH